MNDSYKHLFHDEPPKKEKAKKETSQKGKKKEPTEDPEITLIRRFLAGKQEAPKAEAPKPVAEAPKPVPQIKRCKMNGRWF